MTEIEKAIRVLKAERECVARDCDRDCGHCDLVMDHDWLLSGLDKAIALLNIHVPITRCKDCIYFEPENAEEGDDTGHCRKKYSPCDNQLVDMWWFCGDGDHERD